MTTQNTNYPQRVVKVNKQVTFFYPGFQVSQPVLDSSIFYYGDTQLQQLVENESFDNIEVVRTSEDEFKINLSPELPLLCDEIAFKIIEKE